MYEGVQELRDKYIQINNSFDTALIHHLGIDAGFFAEFKYMIHSMIYCMENHLQFQLYSKDANFGVQNGWTDYFKPFCTEVTDEFHHTLNYHEAPSIRHLLRTFGNKHALNFIKWQIKLRAKNIIGHRKAHKLYGKPTLLNSDVRFRLKDTYSFPELGFKGNYMEAFTLMARIVWSLNDEFTAKEKELRQQLQLPDHYVSCQIRGGDKITEVSLMSPEFIVDSIRKEYGDSMDVFVLTDDYRLFEKVQKEYPTMRFHTLCSKDENGYEINAFVGQKNNSKQEQMMRFFTSVNLMLQSDKFFGSITTGPSVFVLQMKYPDCLPLDCKKEDFPDFSFLPIPARGEIAAKYMKENHPAK